MTKLVWKKILNPAKTNSHFLKEFALLATKLRLLALWNIGLASALLKYFHGNETVCQSRYKIKVLFSELRILKL